MANVFFTGNAKHALDPKGRVTIPNEFRELLGESFTLGMNNDFTAAALYPLESWKEVENELSRIPRTDRRAREYARLILGNSFTNCRMDGQGRVLIPQTLRDDVKLSKDIRFVGAGDCLEIWDEETYLTRSGATKSNIVELEEYVLERYFTENKP